MASLNDNFQPILRMTLTSHDKSEVELDEEDIQGVFERFGDVEVKLEANGKAQIEFKDIVSSYFALTALDGLELSDQRVTINLEWQDDYQIQLSAFPANTLQVTSVISNESYNNQNTYNKNIQNENIKQSTVSPSIQSHQSGPILKQMNSNYLKQNLPTTPQMNPRLTDTRPNNQNLNPISKNQNLINQNPTNLKTSNSQNHNNQNMIVCGTNGVVLQTQNIQNSQNIGNLNGNNRDNSLNTGCSGLNINNINAQNNNMNQNILNQNNTKTNQNHSQTNNQNNNQNNNNSLNDNNNLNINNTQNNNGNSNQNINNNQTNINTQSNNSNNQNNILNSNNNNNNNNNIKYTCRYEIQISNDKDFQVARKIIGSRGENMKTIIKKCLDHNKKKGAYIYQNDDEHGVKLRLRGKGSGYKEGPEKQESQESLHLCVSSMQYNMYKSACFFVEELLQNIYDEYYRMCQQNNLKRDRVYIKKQESTNGKGNTPLSNNLQQSNNQIQQGSNSTQSQSQNINGSNQNNLNGVNINNMNGINQNNTSSSNQNNMVNTNQNINNGIYPNKQNYQQVQYFPVKQEQQQQNNISKVSVNQFNQINNHSQKEIQINSENQQSACLSFQSQNNTSKLEKINGSLIVTNPEQSLTLQNSNNEQSEKYSSTDDLEKNSYENSFVNAGNTNEVDSDSSCSGNQNSIQENCQYIITNNYCNKMNEKQIISLIEQRNKARKESNFLEADRIRNFLKNNGVALMDEKGGRGKGQDVTTWKYSKGSNSSSQQSNSPNGMKSQGGIQNTNKQTTQTQQITQATQQQLQQLNQSQTQSVLINTFNINNSINNTSINNNQSSSQV